VGERYQRVIRSRKSKDSCQNKKLVVPAPLVATDVLNLTTNIYICIYYRRFVLRDFSDNITSRFLRQHHIEMRSEIHFE